MHDLVFTQTFFRKSRKSAVSDGTHRLIRDHGATRGLLDHRDAVFAEADASATEDLFETNRPVARRLGAALTAWEEEQATAMSAVGAPQTIDPDQETDRQLRAMGYLDDER